MLGTQSNPRVNSALLLLGPGPKFTTTFTVQGLGDGKESKLLKTVVEGALGVQVSS